MSHRLINHSPDLRRLVDDGYEVAIISGHLVIENVPYLNQAREIKRGRLISELSLSGDRTIRPQTHVIMFSGEVPCDHRGAPLTKIINGSRARQLGGELTATHDFSSKPSVGFYTDYYEKITTYDAILSSQAAYVDASATARSFRVVESNDQSSPFLYTDTASSRVGIGAMSEKLAVPSVHIVGLGGTGAYVLDLVAKTPVAQIHLHDGDTFCQHNAFRAPGAPSLAQLRRREKKVDFYKGIYRNMHRGITAHAHYIDATNVGQLREASFVFICIDNGAVKKTIIEVLEVADIPFIDVGMGVHVTPDGLIGTLRVTTSTPSMRDHVRDKNRIPLHSANANNDYESNIQIADLNMLNAAMAVTKWKKVFGFYLDLEREHFSALTIDGNHLLNEDVA